MIVAGLVGLVDVCFACFLGLVFAVIVLYPTAGLI